MRIQRYKYASRRLRAFTLIELVIVTVIVAMLASMAIPRIAGGATAASESTLKGDLTVLRKALLIYAAEHNNEFPGPTGPNVMNQLTQYTDAIGRTSGARSGAYRFGPYVAAIPPVPVGPNAGRNAIIIDNVNSPPKSRPATPAGWVYNPRTGEIVPNDGVISGGHVDLEGSAELGESLPG